MIDYVVKFPTETRAQNDPVWGVYYTSGSWNRSCCIPKLLIWDPANDVTNASTGVVTHTPIDTNFHLLVSQSVLDNTLANDPHIEILANRDTKQTLKTIYSPAQMAAWKIQPVFAGSDYPFQGKP
jgi:hypothetical protein